MARLLLRPSAQRKEVLLQHAESDFAEGNTNRGADQKFGEKKVRKWWKQKEDLQTLPLKSGG